MNATLLALTALTLQQPPELVPVDQLFEDVSPLAVSLREMQPTLREPNFFGELYRIRGDDENLVRAQGGLYLVFQRSVYARDEKKGTIYPLVPPNTVFYIGPPPGWTVPAAVQAVTRREVADAGRIDDRLDLRVTPVELTGLADEKPAKRHRVSALSPGNRIVLDADYRAERLRTLMLQAARGPSSSSSK